MNDWICPSCDAHVAESEDKCFCGAERSPDAIRANATVERDPPRFAIGFVKIMVRLGAAIYFGFWCLWLQFASTRPSTSSPDRVYALNTHGSVAYLSHNEEMLLYGLEALAAVLFAMGAITGLALKQRYGRMANFW